MFYCEPCRKKLHWPESFAFSRGKCEICGGTSLCYDRVSSLLPNAPNPRDVDGRVINAQTAAK
jgi:hypothetical protein